MYLKVTLFFLIAISAAFGWIYNTESFSIDKHQTRNIKGGDYGYMIRNIGIPKLTATIIGCHNIGFQTICKIFKTCELENGQHCRYVAENTFNSLEVYIKNNAEIRGLVHAECTYKPYKEWERTTNNYFNIDLLQTSKTMIYIGLAYIPTLGTVLATLFDTFWPSQETSAWDEVKGQVEGLVDSKTKETLQNLLESEIKHLKTRLRKCAQEVDDSKIKLTTGTHYMNIAEDILGLEKKFAINYFLLPLYSTVINLKMKFYQFGVNNQKKIGLEDEHVTRLRDYLNETVSDDEEGPSATADKFCKGKFWDTYSHVYVEQVYNPIASVLTFCAINIYENIQLWKSIAANPYNASVTKDVLPIISFSTLFGRDTADQSGRIVVPNIQPPLKPKIINGKVNKIIKIKVYLTDSNRIGGAKFFYENGDEVFTGREGATYNKEKDIDFEGKKLLKLTARGTGRIDSLEFSFENGRVITTGSPQGNSRTFQLFRHHIVGFSIGISNYFIDKKQAANIAVSYQPY